MVKENFKTSPAAAKKLIEEQGYISKGTTVDGKKINIVVNHADERMGLRE